MFKQVNPVKINYDDTSHTLHRFYNNINNCCMLYNQSPEIIRKNEKMSAS